METKSKTTEERLAEYRLQVRKTFQSMSDQALDFQDARIPRNGNIDRQELERELSRRGR